MECAYLPLTSIYIHVKKAKMLKTTITTDTLSQVYPAPVQSTYLFSWNHPLKKLRLYLQYG